MIMMTMMMFITKNDLKNWYGWRRKLKFCKKQMSRYLIETFFFKAKVKRPVFSLGC